MINLLLAAYLTNPKIGHWKISIRKQIGLRYKLQVFLLFHSLIRKAQIITLGELVPFRWAGFRVLLMLTHWNCLLVYLNKSHHYPCFAWTVNALTSPFLSEWLDFYGSSSSSWNELCWNYTSSHEPTHDTDVNSSTLSTNRKATQALPCIISEVVINQIFEQFELWFFFGVILIAALRDADAMWSSVISGLSFIHTFSSGHPIQGHRGVGSYPNCHQGGGGLHPWRTASLPQA